MPASITCGLCAPAPGSSSWCRKTRSAPGSRRSRRKLDRASLIERAAANGFRITARGRKVLSDHPDGVDETVLLQFREAHAATGRRDAAHEVSPPARSEYEAGYEAYGDGYGLADNPHPADARGHLDWQNGWSQPRDEATRRRR